MKRLTVFLSFLAFITFIGNTLAAVDRATVIANVEAIVEMIENGRDARAIKAEDFNPYAFIMEVDGTMLVHPALSGVDFKEKLSPVYTALSRADEGGVWVEYEWHGKLKHTYAQKTGNLIIGSGY